MTVHPYDDHSVVYNFLFHPKHNKDLKTFSVITHIALSVLTLSLWQFVFWIVNIKDNSVLKQWKVSLDNLPEKSDKIDDLASGILNSKKEDASINSDSINRDFGKKNMETNKQTSIIDQVFPEGNKEYQLVVNIPEQVQKSLDEIFGIENVVGRMPVYEKVLGDDFNIEDVQHPIVKTVDKFGSPSVIIKLAVADPEKYYEDCWKAEDVKGFNCLIKKKKKQEDQREVYLSERKNEMLEDISSEPHFLILGQTYYDGDKLMWSPREHYYQDREPSFFCKKGLLYVDQLTYPHSGNVIESLKDKIPEFQKLFTDGVGTDVYGNQWKLFL